MARYKKLADFGSPANRIAVIMYFEQARILGRLGTSRLSLRPSLNEFVAILFRKHRPHILGSALGGKMEIHHDLPSRRLGFREFSGADVDHVISLYAPSPTPRSFTISFPTEVLIKVKLGFKGVNRRSRRTP